MTTILIAWPIASVIALAALTVLGTTHQRQKQIHRDRVKRAGVGVGVHFHKGGK